MKLSVSLILRISTAGLLLVAITQQPYAFYTVVRLATCLTSCYLIYLSLKSKDHIWLVIFGLIFILFNPIKKFPIGREIWAFIDVISAAIILVSIFLLKEPPTALNYERS